MLNNPLNVIGELPRQIEPEGFDRGAVDQTGGLRISARTRSVFLPTRRNIPP